MPFREIQIADALAHPVFPSGCLLGVELGPARANARLIEFKPDHVIPYAIII